MAEYELFIDVERAGSKQLDFSLGGKRDSPVVKSAEELKGWVNQEIELLLQDPESMVPFKARVIISPKPEELPGAEKLWLRTTKGRFPEPWAVKIVERIEEEESEVRVLPKRRLSLAERKGHMLMDLLKERDEKMKQKEEKGG